MTGEITLNSVLTELLLLMREELNICSEKYNGLEPKKGMEEAWQQARVKVSVLQHLMHALESEEVRAALGKWELTVKKPEERELIAPPLDLMRKYIRTYGHTIEYMPGDKEERQVPGREDFMEQGPEMEPIRI